MPKAVVTISPEAHKQLIKLQYEKRMKGELYVTIAGLISEILDRYLLDNIKEKPAE